MDKYSKSLLKSGIKYPFPNFDGEAADVWEWISNLISNVHLYKLFPNVQLCGDQPHHTTTRIKSDLVKSWSNNMCLLILCIKGSLIYLAVGTPLATRLLMHAFLSEISKKKTTHHNDVIMGATASQITSLTIVYSTVYSDAWNSPEPMNSLRNVSIWWHHHGISISLLF